MERMNRMREGYRSVRRPPIGTQEPGGGSGTVERLDTPTLRQPLAPATHIMTKADPSVETLCFSNRSKDPDETQRVRIIKCLMQSDSPSSDITVNPPQHTLGL